MILAHPLHCEFSTIMHCINLHTHSLTFPDGRARRALLMLQTNFFQRDDGVSQPTDTLVHCGIRALHHHNTSIRQNQFHNKLSEIFDKRPHCMGPKSKDSQYSITGNDRQWLSIYHKLDQKMQTLYTLPRLVYLTWCMTPTCQNLFQTVTHRHHTTCNAKDDIQLI